MSPPDNLIVGHHLDYTSSAWYLDFATGGGNRKPTQNGTVLVNSGGKFGNCARLDQTSHDSLEWNDTGLVDGLVQTGCVSFWVNLQYSGSPSVDQDFFYSGYTSLSYNRITIAHTATGFLVCYIYDSSGVLHTGSVAGAWSPAGSTWYHIEANFDFTAGATRMFVDGSQIGPTAAATATRSSSNNNFLQLGGRPGYAPENEFWIDELLLYDTVQHTAGFTPATEAADLGYTTDPIAAGFTQGS